MDNRNYYVIPKSKVPTGSTILPEVWQIKRKRYIKTRYIKKWNVHLNIYGSRMKNWIHYEHKYASVASCNEIRSLLTLSLLHKWKTVHLDYVLELPQAPVERKIYMKTPKGSVLDTKRDTT